MTNIVIVGAAGHAKVIIDTVELQGKHKIVGLIDPAFTPGDIFHQYTVLGNDSDLPRLITEHKVDGAIIAVGDNFVRGRLAETIDNICPGLPLVTAVHPAATVARDVTLGAGTVVMAGAVINPGCVLGKACIVNTNATLDHDSLMEEFSSVGPGVAAGGNCEIGRYSAVGIGAVIIHNILIGEHTLIAAGATVVTNIASHTTAMGTPAKEVYPRKPGDRYL